MTKQINSTEFSPEQYPYRIKDWAKFQHYKHRNPPWIRLYRELLNDIEWHYLDPVAAKLLIDLWMLAADFEGHIPASKVLAFRLRMDEKVVSSAISMLSHWIEPNASTMLAVCEQHALTETETETEKNIQNEESGLPRKYEFETGVIRLSKKDFDKWQESYSYLDLKAELLGLSKWAEEQGTNWFFAISGALAKRNREEKRKQDVARAGPAPREIEDWNDPEWRKRHRLDGIL